MRHPIGARHRPVVLIQTARITDRKGLQQGRIVTVVHSRRDTSRYRIAHAVDAPWRAGQPGVCRVITHVAGGDDAALQRGALAIRATRVKQAARSLQAQQQTPAGAWIQRWRILIPGHRDASVQRQRLSIETGLLHLQGEAGGVGARQGQVDEVADDRKVQPFHRARQARIHRLRPTPQCPANAQQEAGKPTRSRKTPGQHQRRQGQQQHVPARRQCGKPLHQQHAEQQRCRCRYCRGHRCHSRHLAPLRPGWDRG